MEATHDQGRSGRRRHGDTRPAANREWGVTSVESMPGLRAWAAECETSNPGTAATGRSRGPHRPMTDPDPILARIEAFDRDDGGGVTLCRNRGGHTQH